MRITQEVDYAFRVVLFLSKLGLGQKIEAKSISQQEKIPLRFLLKLLRKLTHSGIIRSFRGVNGGYALNQMPENINLKNVLEAIDGPIYMNRCLYDPIYCNLNRTNSCAVHKALEKVQNSLVKELENISFKNLLDNDI